MLTWFNTLAPPINLTGSALTAYVLFDVFLIILLARTLGNWMLRVGQPRVVGEILAGILLGPTLLGQNLSQVITPIEVRPILNTLATLGLLFFMFIAGLEFDTEKVKGRVKNAVILALLAVGIPALMGFPISYLLHNETYSGAAGTALLPFALFLGSALSVTAFPVMAHILMERGELNSPLGVLSVATAGFVSVFMFNYIGFAGAIAAAAGFGELVYKFFLVVLLVLFAGLIMRPFLVRIFSNVGQDSGVNGTEMAIILGGMVIFGMFTHLLGMTALVGGFLWGLIFPPNLKLRSEITGKVRDVAMVFLLPIFFAVSGYSTDLRLLTSESLPGIGLMLLGAIGGKFLAAVPGRYFGLSWMEVGTLGALLNTRGLLVLVVGLIGLQLAIITSNMFTIFVIVALVTNVMTLPLLNLFHRPQSQTIPVPIK
jgi:Kef-type K+ transport system membrane component KefB